MADFPTPVPPNITTLYTGQESPRVDIVTLTLEQLLKLVLLLTGLAVLLVRHDPLLELLGDCGHDRFLSKLKEKSMTK